MCTNIVFFVISNCLWAKVGQPNKYLVTLTAYDYALYLCYLYILH